MNFKKILCCMLVLLAIVALAACGGNKNDTYYTLSFDSDGGSEVINQSIKENEAATAPITPTKNGYTFAGWYSGDTAWDFTTAITADTALKAKWTPTEYSITYLEVDKATGTQTPITLTPATYTIENEQFVLPAPTKEHYNFMGWYLDAEYKDSIQSVAAGSYGNITLYAKYEVKNYGINYVLVRDGATNSDKNLPSYNINSTFPIVFGAPTLTGFDFLGWFTDANYTTPITEIAALSGDVTVYAKWQESAPVNSYTVTYMDGTDAIEGLNPTFYLEGTTASLPTPAKPQHDFAGWYTTAEFTEGTKLESITAATTGNLVLYAKFVPNEEPAPVYFITYMDGANVISGLAPKTYTLGTEVALPLTEKAHYRFEGWYTTPEFTDGTKIETITVAHSGNITLYAKLVAIEYAITYHLDGGENHPDNENLTKYTVTDTTAFSDPTKEGHKFDGWYTDKHFKNQITDLTNRIGNLDLYAKWTPIGSSGIVTPEHTFGRGQ